MSSSLDQSGLPKIEARPALSSGFIDSLKAISPPNLVVLVATLVGAFLRLFNLNGQSLWLDEAASRLNAVAFNDGGLTALAHADQVAPLHSITLWLATLIGGDSEISLRMPSALAGIALIPLIYILARRLFAAPWVGATAAVLVAISPYAIWYSQEARMYALLLTFTLAFVYISWPVLERPLRPVELVALTVVTTLGYGMHHYMALMSGAFALFLIVEGQALKRRSWAWLATQALSFLVLIAWLYLTRDKLGNSAGTEKPAFFLWVPYTIYTYVVGFSFGPSTRDIQQAGGGVGMLLGHAAQIGLLCLASAILVLTAAWRAAQPDMRRVGRWLLIWLVAPMLIAMLVTRVTNISYNVRYVIACFPALVLVFALAIQQAASKLWLARGDLMAGRKVADLGVPILQGVAAAVLVVCMLISLTNDFTNAHYAKEDMRSLSRALAKLPPDTVVLSDNHLTWFTLTYYKGRILADPLQVNAFRPDRFPDAVWGNFQRVPHPPGTKVALIEYRSWETDPGHSLRAHLEGAAQKVGVEAFPGVRLTRYRIPDSGQAPAK